MQVEEALTRLHNCAGLSEALLLSFGISTKISKTGSILDLCLFDLILYVPSTILQLNRETGLPGLNQY